MKHEARAAVAAAAYAVATGTRVNNLRDHRTGELAMVVASCDGDVVKAHDFRRGGALAGTLPGLFDHAGGTHIDMKRDEGKISGFHYASASFYRVVISGNLAEMFDFADNSWSSFTVS